MKKNDIAIGICEAYTHDGMGIVKVEGFSFFVRGVIYKEEVKFKIIKLQKHYGYGKLIEILHPSIHRVTPMCKYYELCGGCHLQHMDTEEQASFKLGIVENNMQRIGKSNAIILDVLTSDCTSYRNKAQFPVHNNPYQMGFYRLHSNDIVDIEMCPIQSDKINNLYAYLREHLKGKSWVSSLRHILIKHAYITNESMLVFVVREDIEQQLQHFVQDIIKVQPITSVIMNINTTNSNVILGDSERLLYGSDTICEQLMDYCFRIASKSFYQVNPIQTEVLYNKVLEFASLTKEELVIDLYCGVGSISLLLAKESREVIGIEIVEAAVFNAIENAKMNGLKNVSFVCSDAGKYAEKLVEEGRHADVVVVDPPRKGCDQRTLDSIVKIAPDRIVYVSCNPATLARDVHILEGQGYVCKVVQPVDMFPNTYHIETIVLLQRR